jgi:hypothetical protein
MLSALPHQSPSGEQRHPKYHHLTHVVRAVCYLWDQTAALEKGPLGPSCY